jgi:hypothetical protein
MEYFQGFNIFREGGSFRDDFFELFILFFYDFDSFVMFLDNILHLKGHFLGKFLDLAVFDSDVLVEDISKFVLFYLKIIFKLLILIPFDKELEFILIDDCGFFLFHLDDVVMKFFSFEL